MIGKTIERMRRHAREIGRAVAFREYEQCEGGILLPKQGLHIKGEYIFGTVAGGDDLVVPNLLPDQGINAILAVALGSTAKYAGFYIALFGNGVNPAANWTAANFASTAGEITSGTEGYSNSTRVQCTFSAVGDKLINNHASPAVFTIECTTSVTINGAALLTDSTKGGTSGSLISAVRLPAQRLQYDGDEYTSKYQVSLSDS